MSRFNHALELAALGFHVFPVVPNAKLPAIEAYPHLASRDPEQIKRWWFDPVLEIEQPYNIGISTTRFGDNEALVVVDVDNKDGKSGDETLFNLELEGYLLPKTYTQVTPTGGRHLIYRTPIAVKQGTAVLGSGLDIRSRGGYVVGSSSTIDGKVYTAEVDLLLEAPTWLVDRCGYSTAHDLDSHEPIEGLDVERAEKRAIDYLKNGETVNAGQRNHAGFATACHLKDLGVDQNNCLKLMLEHWKCEPMLDNDEVAHVVRSAYRYGNKQVGSASPEAEFKSEVKDPAPDSVHPFDVINKEFAFITAGGGHHILWETTDPESRFFLEHLNESTFHRKFAHWTMTLGNNQTKTVTELWMKSNLRREYRGLCFKPGLATPKGWYNLWRGFAYEALTDYEKPSAQSQESLHMFLDHAKFNVCHGNEDLYMWMMGYFAHLVQRPWEKPLVALVFRGEKGVGKNALIERIGALLGGHFLLTSNKRYLVGNFNGHLENLLLLALDEAFWSGDKQAEGTLKDLITGKNHVIEHKGKEPYSVENCTRVCILGNEEWLVPASHDERRFTVFDVGSGRKQDRTFFRSMREGMEAGGYRLLLRHLMDFNLSRIDVNQAPSTKGLMDQKVSSLDPLQQWWLDCLSEGRIVGADFSEGWPEEVEKEGMRMAFRRYIKERQIRSRIPEDHVLGRRLHSCIPSIVSTKKRESFRTINTYRFPDLERARKEWENFIGHNVVWE